jgi:DNA-binding NarL/FixJ family response regulator
VRTVALVADLMDRSKIGVALPDVAFASTADACADADLVVVDLGGHRSDIAAVRDVAPDARIVAFGRHDDPEALARAREDGADLAVPRSRFFRDPAGVLEASDRAAGNLRRRISGSPPEAPLPTGQSEPGPERPGP